MQDRLDDSDNEESDVLFQNNLEIDRTGKVTIDLYILWRMVCILIRLIIFS